MATTAVGNPFLIGFASLFDPIRRHHHQAALLKAMMRWAELDRLPDRPGLAGPPPRPVRSSAQGLTAHGAGSDIRPDAFQMRGFAAPTKQARQTTQGGET